MVQRRVLFILAVVAVIAAVAYFVGFGMWKKESFHGSSLFPATIAEERQLPTQGRIGEILDQFDKPEGHGTVGGSRAYHYAKPEHTDLVSGVWSFGENTQLAEADAHSHALHTGKPHHTKNYLCGREGESAANGCCEHVPELYPDPVSGLCKLTSSPTVGDWTKHSTLTQP